MKKNHVGLGTYPLASSYHKISKHQAKKIVQQFLESGGYYIDTAPLYGHGDVEKLLGEILIKYPRHMFYLSTKCGSKYVNSQTPNLIKKSGKYQDVINECNRSLQRLRLDYIDLYYVHSPDLKTPFSETIAALVKLQKEGKIKKIGVSNVSLIELQNYNKNGNVSFVQNRFSLLNRSISEKFKSYIYQNSIQIIPYHVIDRGLLTDTVFKKNLKFSKYDPRSKSYEWTPMRKKVISDWSKSYLLPIAQKLKINLSQLALAWAIQQSFISYIIVGMTDPNHVKTNLQSDTIKLSKSVMKKIENAYIKLNNFIRERFNQSIYEFRGMNDKYFKY